MTAESGGAGKGSEFSVRLPVATGELRGAEPARPQAAAPRRVLIVDDNRDLALSLEMLLSRSGYEVRTAFDSQGALEVAAEQRPEVVLLDIGLPDVDGYETCRRLRALPWGREALLVAVTGWGLEEDERRALEAGFDRHLTKPVDPQVVRELLGE